MPHSLRVKLKGLNYKKLITDRELERLCKALDKEDVLEQIRDEIKQEYDNQGDWSFNDGLAFALEIIDKYTKGEQE